MTFLAIFAGITLFAISTSTRLDRYMSLTYMVIAALGLQLTLKSVPVGLFVIWTAFVFWIHPMTPVMAALIAVIYTGGLLYLISVPVSKDKIYNLICCYAIANVLWQVLQIPGWTFGYQPIFSGHHTLVGLQTNVGEMSALMAICLPAFFRKRWVWLIWVPLAGMVMSEEIVGFFAAAIAGCVAIFSTRSKDFSRIERNCIGSFAVMMLIAAGLLYLTIINPHAWEIQKHSRLQTWKESTVIALEKPLGGWGYGQFCAVVPLLSTPTQLLVEDRKRLYGEVEDKKAFLRTAEEITGGDAATYYTNKKYPQSFFFEAHNEYVEVLFAAGIPGVLLLFAALASILWKGLRRCDRIPFYGLLASCLSAGVWFIWQIVPIAVVTVVWMGMCLKHESGHKGGPI